MNACSILQAAACIASTALAEYCEPSTPGEACVDDALRRMARAEEIADAILFLTSNESSFVTGSTLVVDGGRTYQ